jgi:hypothetical protein
MPMPNTPFWLIIVDECTQLKRVEFFHRKNEIGKYLCELFHKDRSDGRHVRYVRRDNAGENHTYRDRAQSSAWKLNIRFEFTSRSTPQHNSLAETGFATLLKRARALFADANIPLEFRYRLYKEVIGTAAKLDSLNVISVDELEKSR